MYTIREEDLALFKQQQYNRLVQGPPSICTPTKSTVFGAYAPIELLEYPYQAQVGPLTSPAWKAILRCPAGELISGDPYAPSTYRPGGYKIWDSAIGIPACTLRKPSVQPLSSIKPISNTNTYFTQDLKHALGQAGLDNHGQPARIAGPWIIDLTQLDSDEGWAIAEAMHVWAHYRATYKKQNKIGALRPSFTVKYIQEALGLYAVSKFLNLPLYVGHETEPWPHFRHYGINVKVITNFMNSTLVIPWTAPAAPCFDKTIATILVAVRIEPEPVAFSQNNTEAHLMDIWSGYPTVAAIIGWERVDSLMHQTLVSQDIENARRPICYGMHAADLNHPGTLPYLIELAKRAKGIAVEDDNNMTFDNWIASDRYLQLWDSTPPRPCAECLSWQIRSDWAVRRPAEVDFKGKTAQSRQYNKRVSLFLKLVRKAELKKERQIRQGSRLTVKSIRQRRTINYKRRLKEIKRQNAISRACAKLKAGKKELTAREYELYCEHCKTQNTKG